MIPRAVKGGYVDPATGSFIPTGDAAGGKVTEFQAKNALFSRIMQNTSGVIDKYEDQGSDLYGRLVDKHAPTSISNYLQTKEGSTYYNAQREWAENMLRLMTGAAAPDAEVVRYNQQMYFPQPGESVESIARKRQLRHDIMEQIKLNAGHALPPGAAQPAAPAGGGDARRAAIEAEARKRGLLK
jgi:hypothetical protein